jgi:hypothetical protein
LTFTEKNHSLEGAMKKIARAKSHDRAAGETQITISLPKELKDEVSRLAREDDRSRSKWIVRELTALVKKKKSEQKIVPLENPGLDLALAAEEPPPYRAKRRRA